MSRGINRKINILPINGLLTGVVDLKNIIKSLKKNFEVLKKFPFCFLGKFLNIQE